MSMIQKSSIQCQYLQKVDVNGSTHNYYIAHVWMTVVKKDAAGSLTIEGRVQRFLPPELDELESLLEDASDGLFFLFLAVMPWPPT